LGGQVQLENLDLEDLLVTLVSRERLDLEGFQVYLVYLDPVVCLDQRETEDPKETQVGLALVRKVLLDLKDQTDFLDLLVWENLDLRDSVDLLASKDCEAWLEAQGQLDLLDIVSSARLLECRQTLEDKRRDKMDTDQALTLYGLRDWMTQEMTARLSTHSNPPQLPPSKIIFTAEVVTIIKDVWLPFTIVISIIKTVTNYALHLHQIHYYNIIYKFTTIIN